MVSNKSKFGINSIILLAILSSCSPSKIKTVINGSWTIDTIFYKRNDIFQCLGLNVLSFKENDKCELPVLEDCNGITDYNREGTWKLIDTENSPIVLNIFSRNKIFNGKYIIKFIRDDKNKLLKMKIQSDLVYWISSKTIFNFEDNIGLINDLVKRTN